MPLLVLSYFCSYLDRANVGIAGTTMVSDLHFSYAVFGFGAGVFNFGYFLGEIPSNLILNKIGARVWIARILMTWGIIAGVTAFVWNDWSFYCIRILLGLAEAGLYPGIVLYLTWWFPSYYRTRMMGIILSAAVISMMVGPPIGGLLLYMEGLAGLHGWQWLFIIETLPSIVTCFIIWKLLTDRPSEADWLTPQQRTWLAERLDSERAQREAIHKFTLAEAFYSPKVCLLTVAYIFHTGSQNILNVFLPLIVKGLGVPTGMIGLVSGVPFVFALVAMNYWGWRSDVTGERTWHVVGAWLVCAVGMGACILIGGGHPVLLMIAMCVAAMGTWAAPVAFWALPSALLTGTAAAGGIALINSVGCLGSWFGPWAYGLVKDATGSDNVALLCLASWPIVSAILVILAGHDRRLERIPPRRDRSKQMG
jgi:MFS family permease